MHKPVQKTTCDKRECKGKMEDTDVQKSALESQDSAWLMEGGSTDSDETMWENNQSSKGN